MDESKESWRKQYYYYGHSFPCVILFPLSLCRTLYAHHCDIVCLFLYWVCVALVVVWSQTAGVFGVGACQCPHFCTAGGVDG